MEDIPEENDCKIFLTIDFKGFDDNDQINIQRREFELENVSLGGFDAKETTPSESERDNPYGEKVFTFETRG